MALLPLATNAYHRTAAALPEIRLVNRYLEPDRTNQIDGVAILARPGLALNTTLSTASRGVFRQSGVLNGDWLIVSGSTLYRMPLGGSATSIGTIAGSDLVEFASDGTNTFIAAGTLYLYDGTTLSTVAVPDSLSITSLRQLNGYIILQVAEEGKFFWIAPGETTIDALDFATAERSPDPGVAIRLQGDFLVLQQSDGEEFWVTTADPDSPFQRQSGIVSDRGCSFREASVNVDNGRVWVTEDSDHGRIVVRSAQGVPERISVFGIEERMRGATTISALVLTFDGHAFYVLRIDGVGTFACDLSQSPLTWSEFTSYGLDNWRPICAGQAPGGPVLFGSAEDGKMYTLDASQGNDDGDPIQRVVTGIVPVVGEREILRNVSIFASVGRSPNLTLEPKISLRIAKDGFTFSDPRERSLGFRGEYGKRVGWERCGEMVPPGCVLEFSDSDDAPTRISFAQYNTDF